MNSYLGSHVTSITGFAGVEACTVMLLSSFHIHHLRNAAAKNQERELNIYIFKIFQTDKHEIE